MSKELSDRVDKFYAPVIKKLDGEIAKLRKARKERPDSWTQADESVLFSLKCHKLTIVRLNLLELKCEKK